jgi:hypothetical protein
MAGNGDRPRWDPLKVTSFVLALVALLIALLVVYIVFFNVTSKTVGDALSRLTVVVGYEILILVFFFGLMVLLYMAAGKIDLSMLLCEPKGDAACAASMSRFQLLIFTLVISLSLFLIIVANGAKSFPGVPSEILLLLGISASTYAVGKGIQASGNGNGGGGAVGHAAPGAAKSAAGAAQGAAAAAEGAAAAAQAQGGAGAAHGAAAAHRAAADAHGAAAKAHAAAAAAHDAAAAP